MMTVGDLAADWSWMDRFSGFHFPRSSVVWEQATYTPTQAKVRVSRLVPLPGHKLRQINQYVDPGKEVEFVREG